MKKLYDTLARISIIILVGVVAWMWNHKNFFNNHHDHSEKEEAPPEVCDLNWERYIACREDLLTITCLVEGFHEEPYFCGQRWTIGSGTTIYPDGTPVSEQDDPISLEYAKQCVFDHYDQCVWPYIEKYVTRELNCQQMIGTCSFIYNIGGEAFSGHKENGQKVGEPSNFLLAINAGKSDYETALCMNGFRSSGGKLAKGLPKRHWIEGAVYQGLITTEDILTLEPKKFYESRLSFYYKNRKDPFWTPDYSEKKIRRFLQKNLSEKKNVKKILATEE